MEELMKELTELLNQVPDTYDDFIAGVRCEVKGDEESIQDVINFIKEDPTRTSSDILEYLDELFEYVIEEDEIE